MKKINLIYSLVFLLVLAAGCSKKDGIDKDLAFLNSAASGNLAKIFDISNDNSGNVKITPTGEGVTSWTINFGHGTGATASAVVTPGGSTIHSYPEGSYTVTIIAQDIAGHQTTTTYPLQLTYRAPENVTISTSGEVQVSASALYAKSFLVYYGDVANEVGTPMTIGQTLPVHTYPAGTATPFVLRVVALSGGAATTTATKTLFGLPIDFETAAVNYFFGTFGGVALDKVANPAAGGINTSATVGRYTKHAGDASWSGTYSPLDIPINFAQGRKIKVWAYNPSAANIGKKVNVELEWSIGGPANGVGVLRAPFTTSGAWEELVFDFSTIPAIPANTKYTQLVLRFDDGNNGAGEVFYLDNFRLTN